MQSEKSRYIVQSVGQVSVEEQQLRIRSGCRIGCDKLQDRVAPGLCEPRQEAGRGGEGEGQVWGLVPCLVWGW